MTHATLMPTPSMRPLVALLVLAPLCLAAQAPAAGDWSFSAADTRPVTLPAGVSLDTLEFEYDNAAPVAGLAADLNRDGQPDLFVRSAPSLCGATGNCSYAVIDGASKAVVGLIGGSLLYVRAKRTGGWPIIQTWWHMSAGSGLYTTYVFDGAAYTTVASTPVEGEGLTALFHNLQTVPHGPPH